MTTGLEEEMKPTFAFAHSHGHFDSFMHAYPKQLSEITEITEVDKIIFKYIGKYSCTTALCIREGPGKTGKRQTLPFYTIKRNSFPKE